MQAPEFYGPWLVGGGVGDLVDDECFCGAFGGLEFEAELFLEDGEEGRVGGVRSFFWGPFDLEVEVAFEVGVILDGAACLAAKCGGDVCHGHLRDFHDDVWPIVVGAHVGLRVGSAWLECRAEFPGLVEFEPVDGGFFLLAMELELEPVFEEREEELLELLWGGDFGVIGGGGVDVEGLAVSPIRAARYAVVVGAEGDADEGADGSGSGYEASAGEDAAVGGFVAGGSMRADGDDFKSQRRLSGGWRYGCRLSLGWSR
jgi:hypothetical protein